MKNDNGNLAGKLKNIVAAAGRIRPGTITHIEIFHEDGCPALKTNRIADCTCKPIIEVAKG